MVDEKKPGISDGIRTGISLVAAFKDTLEETVEEVFERGDVNRDRAKRAIKEAVDRIQATVEEAGGRLELVPRREFDALKLELADLRARVDQLEGATRPDAEPTRPSDGIPVD